LQALRAASDLLGSAWLDAHLCDLLQLAQQIRGDHRLEECVAVCPCLLCSASNITHRARVCAVSDAYLTRARPQ
jgi:hypothetical protein